MHMRIHLISDLHLGFEPYYPEVLDVDLVILAGDIDIKARGVAWARKTFPGHVLYVPGNHEFYGGHLEKTLEKMRTEKKDRVQVLDLNEVIIDGVRFLGATMWTDYTSKGNAANSARYAHGRMNDFSQIRTGNYRRIGPADLIELSRKTRSWLSAKLLAVHEGPTVVITHHAPSLRSLIDNPHAGNELDAAYANSWEDLMGSGVTLWAHGHSHVAVDYEIAGTRIVCNPRGYPGEETGFNASLVLTL